MNKNYRGYIFIALATIIFSTVEVALKFGQNSFPPLQLLWARFFIGGIVLLPFALKEKKKRNIEKFSTHDILEFAFHGFLIVCFSMAAYQIALTKVKASEVALILSLNVIIGAILAKFLLNEPLYKNQIIAFAIEVLAIYICIDPLHTQRDKAGTIISLITAISFGIYGVNGKRLKKFGGAIISSFGFIFGGLEQMLLLKLGQIEPIANFLIEHNLSLYANVPIIPAFTKENILIFLYLAIMVSGGGFVFHMMGIEKTSVAEGGLVYFIKPAFAPIFAMIILKEQIDLRMGIAIIIFVLGAGIALIPNIIREKKNKCQKI